MFNIKATISLILFISFVGCSERTIILQPGEISAPPKSVSRTKYPSPPPIKEEILIKKNPNLGHRIDVPQSNPRLGTTVKDEDKKEESITQESQPVASHSSGVMERLPFPASEYNALRKRGQSTVTGTIYVENTNSSAKIFGKKVKLWLNPVTSYSRQWYQEDFLGGYKLSKIDKRIFNYMKLDYSDMNGHFTFSGIPRGDYYLVGTVKCTEACGLSENKTIRLVKPIYVGKGVTKVDLSKYVP